MKVTSSKNIILTNEEVKQALLDWVYSKSEERYHNLMLNKGFEIDFDGDTLYIAICGEIVEYESGVKK